MTPKKRDDEGKREGRRGGQRERREKVGEKLKEITPRQKKLTLQQIGDLAILSFSGKCVESGNPADEHVEVVKSGNRGG